MDNILELQPNQVVRVWIDHLTTGGYCDAIITAVDYDNDEIEVTYGPGRYRLVSVRDVEVPR